MGPAQPPPAQLGASAAEEGRLGSQQGWGAIEAVINGPLINVPQDTWWISVVLCWLLLPLNLIQGALGGTIGSVLVCLTIGGGCCCGLGGWCTVYRSVMAGRPWYLAFNMWRYLFAMLIGLKAQGSRFALFAWESKSFRQSRYFWHGEGVWSWTYKDCDAILRGSQMRKRAFACFTGVCPDLFAENLLIFLPNSDSDDGAEWKAIRHALHRSFLEKGGATYKHRLEHLSGRVRDSWPSPKLADFNDLAKVQATVCKSIFFMMFGIWIEDAEAAKLANWRKYASFFILPRIAHRFLFNIGIRRVKQLRVDTVRLIEKYELQGVFQDMNASLPEKYRRTPVVKLCDEIMYAVGFAGIGGTCACVESVGAFMQVKVPFESSDINFGNYKTSEEMLAAYAADPEAYIKETCRLDPPVTSATSSLQQDEVCDLAGQKLPCPAGTLNQYALSVANRDPGVFQEPNVFNPGRGLAVISRALTWNGAFGVPDDERRYPRICPGRYLALDVAKAVIDHVVSGSSAGAPATNRA